MGLLTSPDHVATERTAIRQVAMPSEHGGWGLTLEPVLLGVLIAWSWPGLAIGLAAVVAFIARTPTKLVAVDVRRRRWLPRTSVASRVAAVEVALLAVLVVVATIGAGWRWWSAVVLAVPLVAVEVWFEVRSRGRRLAPELCGAIGVAAVVAAIVLADPDASVALALGAWLVLAARSLSAIPFVRTQILRRRGVRPVPSGLAWDVGAVALALAASVLDRSLVAGSIGVLALVAVQRFWGATPPPVPKVIGLRQLGLGLTLVAVTAIGVLAWPHV